VRKEIFPLREEKFHARNDRPRALLYTVMAHALHPNREGEKPSCTPFAVFIHVLLVIAVVLFLVGLVSGRRVV